MWRTVYKLTKTLSDQPGPRNVADRVKGKIDKFKQHLPILHTICNPGIRERHWEQMSDIMGFDIRPSDDSSLMSMLEYGLHKQLSKYVAHLFGNTLDLKSGLNSFGEKHSFHTRENLLRTFLLSGWKRSGLLLQRNILWKKQWRK